MGARTRLVLGGFAILLATAPATYTWAQPTTGGPSLFQAGNELQVSAQDKIIWDRDRKLLIVEGHVVFVYRGKKLYADRALAYYRLDKSGKRQFYSFTATGSVRLSTPSYVIHGSKLTYDLRNQSVKMIGRSRIVTREAK